MPYQTVDNTPTSFKIAIRENVSVNCILGMSFINAARLFIDSNDSVIESKLLQINPFEIIYKLSTKSSPNLVPRVEPSNKNLIIKQEIYHTQSYISSLSYQQETKGILKNGTNIKPNQQVLSIINQQNNTTLLPDLRQKCNAITSRSVEFGKCDNYVKTGIPANKI